MQSCFGSSIRGSFQNDLANGYNLKWASAQEFKSWIRSEMSDKCIEFTHHETKHSEDGPWTSKRIFICSRARISLHKYTPKTKRSQNLKISSKKTGCNCRLTVKTYRDYPEILGLYRSEHSHDIGSKNLPFTRVPKPTRQHIERLLRDGFDPAKVLVKIQGDRFKEDNLDTINNNLRREDFITRADIRRIERRIERETIRLARDDGASTLHWVSKLQGKGHFVVLKTKSNPSPAGFVLQPGTFIVIIQTKYQQTCWEKWGHNRFAGIDATHNTTMYEKLSLFTIIVRDDYKHGMPVAWMIASNGEQQTIEFYLKTIRDQNPKVIPSIFMTDKDHAQMNAIEIRYPESKLLLCWWHVLHAWQQHFVIQHYEELWSLLKKWIRMQDETEFQKTWEVIQTLCPENLTLYFRQNWMKQPEMWSAVYRKDVDIYSQGDTNMLVEAWHHILKGHLLQGKRNRRLDMLVATLVEQAIPLFLRRHLRQQYAFEGKDVGETAHDQMDDAANLIDSASIVELKDEKYRVKSQTQASVSYDVNRALGTCTCSAFRLAKQGYCKHLAAVLVHFPAPTRLVPIEALSGDSVDNDEHENDIFSDSDNETWDLDNLTPEPPNPLHVASEIASKLSSASLALQRAAPRMPLKSLKDFDRHLSEFVEDINAAALTLPPAVSIAPNQHSWTETKDVMGVAAKSKRKSKHLDPYSGGERSGKKACLEAQRPLVDVSNVTETATASTSSGQPITPTTLPLSTFKPAKSLFTASDSNFQPTTDSFDPKKADYKWLAMLHRNQLFSIAELHTVKRKGSNYDIADELGRHWRESPCVNCRKE